MKGVPKVHYEGQGGLLFVALSPTYARDESIYLTYAEPGPGGDGLALARARLDDADDGARLTDLRVLWRQLPRGAGGQFGRYIALSPDNRFLFLTVGEPQRFRVETHNHQVTSAARLMVAAYVAASLS